MGPRFESTFDFFPMGLDVVNAVVVVDGGYAVRSGWEPQLPVAMVVRCPLSVVSSRWTAKISSLSPKAAGARL